MPGVMIPWLRDAAIGNMVAAKLYIRRVLRRHRAGARSSAARVVLHSDGLYDSDDAIRPRSKMRGSARLPARPPDRVNAFLVCGLLFVGAICVRGYRIAEPNGVVFDELHFGKFVKAYWPGGVDGPQKAGGGPSQRGGRLYFDIHPPYVLAS
jgi:hypothetical protein